MLDFSRTISDLQVLASRSSLVTRLAVKLRNQCQMIVNYHISPDGIHISRNGEGRLLEALAPHFTKFIDVGANTGQWTDLVLTLAPSDRRVILFEPSESAMRMLEQRFSQVPAVKLVHMAVGDVPGMLEFYEEPEAGLTSSSIAEFSSYKASRREVPLTTLDIEVMKLGWDRVDFLKIDVEGYDFHVIRGASHLLSEQRIGVLQFEYNKPWADVGSTLGAAVRLLSKNGYRVFLLRGSGLHPLRFQTYHEYFGYSNFVAVSPAVLPSISNLIREEI